jgi:ASPIC and UnbV/Secretion system C-terminal sorting domain/FG-GAP-like repeat
MIKKLFLSTVFAITINSINAQTNCGNATLISAGLHNAIYTAGGSIPSPICAANGTGATNGIWYRYIPTANYTVTISTNISQNNPLIDTRFHVYSGACGSLTCVGGDDDSGSNFSSVGSFTATSGTTYYIAWDNRWNSSNFAFNMTEVPYVAPVPPPVTFTASTTSITMPGSYNDCVVDLNGDYLDDIISVVNNTSMTVNYQQPNGTYVVSNKTLPSVTNLPTWSVCAGDIDKNGYNDLVFGSGNGVSFLFANSTGTNYTHSAGSQYVFSQRSNMVDFNNDGDLDAFVCHDVAPNVYYTNDGFGNLTFNQGGMGDVTDGGNYGSIFSDFDNDNDQDLFIAKCRGGNSLANINEMHINNGSGVYTNVAATTNLADNIQTWSSAVADFDNDGDMDIFVGASSGVNGMHKLMRNNGTTSGVLNAFTDVTATSGWPSNTSLGIENYAGDFDNDGFVDVFGASGKIMFNKGNMYFEPTTYMYAIGPVGDLNNDGFLDFLNNNAMIINNGNTNKWIKLTLQGVQSNRNGIGARVKLFGAWGTQIRDVRSGEAFSTMNTLNVHFGIGQATSIIKAEIHWPSGVVDVINNPAINQTLHVIEGSFPLNAPSFATAGISIYPNPSSSFIQINNSDSAEISIISIYDSLGKLVKEFTNTTDNKIDISTLSNGIYILNIETKDGNVFSEKIIKE